jgi:hypothetical protein
LFIQCSSFIHLVERTVASFEENPIHTKSCSNCKYFIENENVEFSRCSKFAKPKNRHRSSIGKEYKEPLVKYLKANHSDYYDKNNNFSTLLLFYLATTCRKNEAMCGIGARYYERKFFDF